jgi:aryl-alcohol dehydrogenase-like predicted oxidoreductase
MNKRQIGRTGRHVNEIGYGAMSLSIDAEKRPSEQMSIALIERIVDELGIELIDTADAYCVDENDVGHNERLIARALSPEQRARVVVATKGGAVRTGGRWLSDGTPGHLRAACERSLVALGTERIDLYQYHRPDPGVPLAESVGELARLKEEGKIAAIGLSNATLDQLREASAITRIDSIQNPLAFVFYQPELHDPLLQYCESEQITFLAYAPLAGYRNAARLTTFWRWVEKNLPEVGATSIYELALAWLLNLSPVVIPIPSSTHFERVAENIGASRLQLDRDQLMRLARDVEEEHSPAE